MIEFGENSVELRNNLIDKIDGGLCNSFEGGNSNPEEEFDAAASILVVILEDLQNFAKNELTDIRETFATDVSAIGIQMTNTTDTVQILAHPSYYAGPTIALGFFLFIGLLLAWREVSVPKYFCFHKWFIMPLVFILISISIIVIAAVAAVLVANSGK